MKINWFSRKGFDRVENRDAAGVIDSQVAFLGLIVDGGTKGPKGAAFVKTWITEALNDMAAHAELTVDQALRSMRQALIAIRFKYPAETACYTALLLRHDIQKAWSLTCGDCRLGFEPEGEELGWLTPVHTVEQYLNGTLSRDSSSLDVRHIVTRCLNTRRFREPEIIELQYSKKGQWLLASDGYWTEVDGECLPRVFDDDVSFLRIGESLRCSTIDSDVDNLFGGNFS